MTGPESFERAMALIWDRSGYDRGFISNPFAGDDAARLGLIRTARILGLLGNPERAYPIVHVAGSKGKGSTCTFIDSILRSAGATSGRFLSPHLHSYLERFVVDDQPIGEQSFTRLVGEVHAAALDVEAADPAIGQLTAWELSTAMALLWFSRSHCDVAVIEVGMGGTLDATNVVSPAVAAITRLDYEHTSILGETMTEIASNKAGIIKPGVPVVCAVQPEEGLRAIEARASELRSPLLVANRDWTITGTDESFSVTGPDWRYTNLRSSLAGQHQVENAGLAIAAVNLLADAPEVEFDVPPRAVRDGLATTYIPGRFETLSHVSGATIVIDGAHTPGSMLALAATLVARYEEANVTVVAGMLSDKDPESVLVPLVPLADRWIVAPVQSPRSLSAERVRASLERLGAGAATSASIAEAVQTALAPEPPTNLPRVVVITGSFTTVAEARTALGLA